VTLGKCLGVRPVEEKEGFVQAKGTHYITQIGFGDEADSQGRKVSKGGESGSQFFEERRGELGGHLCLLHSVVSWARWNRNRFEHYFRGEKV